MNNLPIRELTAAAAAIYHLPNYVPTAQDRRNDELTEAWKRMRNERAARDLARSLMSTRASVYQPLFRI